ncbi:MAG: cysteine hydrolase [Blastocatellia bacterium]|nr:cysteine hydrolase [Blastocatellia bacterium]
MSKQRLVFVDVDTQFDFMDPKGSLYVPGAIDIVPNLQKLTEYAKSRGILVVASVDAHRSTDPEFVKFPPHCIAGTEGQKKIPATEIEPAYTIDAEISDFSLPEMGSVVLEKTVFSLFGNKNAEQVFKRLSPDKLVVFGVATDYCVKAAAIGLAERGYDVALVTDAVSSVTQEGGVAALDEMQKAGVEMVKTLDVLSW